MYTLALSYFLLSDLDEVASLPDWRERLAEALRESRANYRLILAWLDARYETREHDGCTGPPISFWACEGIQ